MAISSTSSSYLILAKDDKYLELRSDPANIEYYVHSMENAARFPDNKDQLEKLKVSYPCHKIYKVVTTVSLYES